MHLTNIYSHCRNLSEKLEKGYKTEYNYSSINKYYPQPNISTTFYKSRDQKLSKLINNFHSQSLNQKLRQETIPKLSKISSSYMQLYENIFLTKVPNLSNITSDYVTEELSQNNYKNKELKIAVDDANKDSKKFNKTMSGFNFNQTSPASKNFKNRNKTNTTNFTSSVKTQSTLNSNTDVSFFRNKKTKSHMQCNTFYKTYSNNIVKNAAISKHKSNLFSPSVSHTTPRNKKFISMFSNKTLKSRNTDIKHFSGNINDFFINKNNNLPDTPSNFLRRTITGFRMNVANKVRKSALEQLEAIRENNIEYPLHVITMLKLYKKEYEGTNELVQQYVNYLNDTLRAETKILSDLNYKKEKLESEIINLVRKVGNKKKEIQSYLNFKVLCVQIKYKSLTLEDIKEETLNKYGLTQLFETRRNMEYPLAISQKKGIKRQKSLRNISYNKSVVGKNIEEPLILNSRIIGNNIYDLLKVPYVSLSPCHVIMPLETEAEEPVFKNANELVSRFNDVEDFVMQQLCDYTEKMHFLRVKTRINKENLQQITAFNKKELKDEYLEYLLSQKERVMSEHKELEKKHRSLKEDTKNNTTNNKILSKMINILSKLPLNIEEFGFDNFYNNLKNKEEKIFVHNQMPYTKLMYCIIALEKIMYYFEELKRSILLSDRKDEYLEIEKKIGKLMSKRKYLENKVKSIHDRQLVIEQIINKSDKVYFLPYKKSDKYNKYFMYTDKVKKEKDHKEQYKQIIESLNGYEMINY